MFSVTELSKMAGVSRQTIYGWKKAGLLDSEMAKRGIGLQKAKVVGAKMDVFDTVNLTPPPPETSPPIKEEISPQKIKVENPKIGERTDEEQKDETSETKETMDERMRRKAREMVEHMNKKFPGAFSCGVGTIQGITFLPTGIKKLDAILGGGLAKGRLIELFGVESAGKTSLATQIVVHFQKQGLEVAYLDFEQAFDHEYAINLGLDMEKLGFSQPDGMEDGLEHLREICRERKADLVIVDSVAAMRPSHEYDGMIGDAHMGLKARILGQAVRLIISDCNKKGVTVLFINQIRKSMEFYGPKEFTPGGMALRFGASQRIQMKPKSNKDKYERREVEVICIKNKCYPPYGKTLLTLEYGKGFTN